MRANSPFEQPGLYLLPCRTGERVLFVCGNAPVKFFGLLSVSAKCGRMSFKVFPKCVQQLEFLDFGKAPDIAGKGPDR
jgi:hypothetical protein